MIYDHKIKCLHNSTQLWNLQDYRILISFLSAALFKDLMVSFSSGP